MTEKRSGVKDPSSTSRIHCSYARFFLDFRGDDNLQKGGGAGLKVHEH